MPKSSDDTPEAKVRILQNGRVRIDASGTMRDVKSGEFLTLPVFLAARMVARGVAEYSK